MGTAKEHALREVAPTNLPSAEPNVDWVFRVIDPVTAANLSEFSLSTSGILDRLKR
jgi:hypothetical protein